MRLGQVQQPLVQRIIGRALHSGRLSHAYLLVGEPGLGQREAALAVVAALLCASPGPDGACGTCGACVKVAAGNHPDVLWVEPDGASFKTAQVAAVVRELRYRPLEGRCRCVVLVDADLMTAEAANRLLKTLEEPPTEAVLLLLASDASRLPETILSRCQRVPFRPVPHDDLAERLAAEAAVPPARARWLARLARGNPERARALAGHPGLDAVRVAVLTALERGGRGDVLGALAAAEEVAGLGGEDVQLALDIAETALRDAWLHARGVDVDSLVNADLPERIAELGEAWGGVDLEAAVACVCRARQRLQSHVGTQGVVDAMLLELQAMGD